MNKTFDDEMKDAKLAEKLDVMRFFEESTKSLRESLPAEEKHMIAIADYRTQVTKLQHENSFLKDRVDDLTDENTRYRDEMKDVYLAKQKGNDSVDKENLGDEHQKVLCRKSENMADKDLIKHQEQLPSDVLVLQQALADRDNQIRNQNETIEDLIFEVSRVTKFYKKPDLLVRENDLLRAKIAMLESRNSQYSNFELQQKLERSELKFKQDLQVSEYKFQQLKFKLTEKIKQVKMELNATNDQIGMLVEQNEREKEQTRKECLAEVEQKNKYIVELEQTIQTLKQW